MDGVRGKGDVGRGTNIVAMGIGKNQEAGEERSNGVLSEHGECGLM